MRAFTAVLAIVLLGGCALYDGITGTGSGDDAPTTLRIADVPARPNLNLDVLFVIDNSGDMADEQTSLVQNFPNFLNVLATNPPGMPSYHFGVVTSNMGGTDTIPTCLGDGDDGLLQHTGCTALTGSYISDIDDGGGGRETNYTGTLSDVFGCIADVGTGGCGFEQHLASMRRALTSASNPGFYRPDANLLVVILADEDDCSADDTALFDGGNTALGPMSSYRCFEYGVTCDDGNDTPRAVGARSGCGPMDDSPYLVEVEEYAAFLRGLKEAPAQVAVATISGDREPVNVELDPMLTDAVKVSASCQSANGAAAPGIRLAALADAVDDSRVVDPVSSVCDPDLSDELSQVALRAAVMGGLPCLFGEDDADLETLASTCTVTDVVDLGEPTEARSTIPRCDGGAAQPCFHFDADPSTCAVRSHNGALTVERSVEPPSGTRTIVDCPLP